MNNFPKKQTGLKTAAMTLAFLASLAPQIFAKNNANPATNLETGKTLTWNMPDAMPSNGFHADGSDSWDDKNMEWFWGGNEVKSKAKQESIDFLWTMLRDCNGVIYGETIADSLIAKIDSAWLHMVVKNITSDLEEYEKINKRLSDKSAKVRKNVLTINMPDIPLTFKKWELKIGKDEQNNVKAKAIETSREAFLKSYEESHKSLCKKISLFRFNDEQSKTEATKKAILEESQKLYLKLKKIWTDMLNFQKTEYENGPKAKKKN